MPDILSIKPATKATKQTESVVSGYAHAGYARSLAEFGRPLYLPHSNGWILKRLIPGLADYDAMGCYPLFTCQDWSSLHLDLAEIGNQLVSLALVTDPFGYYSLPHLRRCFPDVVRPFKEHFVIDLCCSPDNFVSKHHQRYAKRALRQVKIDCCPNPPDFLDDWLELYRCLIATHNIQGVARFSRAVFAGQLQLPGMVMFRASYQGITIGMLLWYVSGAVGYFHLGASSAVGYRLGVSFGLFWRALEYFSDQGLRWLNLGANAGLTPQADDSLSLFKRGWSTGTKSSFFCGRIFDHARYEALVSLKSLLANDYFPAYRYGEFSVA